MTAAGDGAEGLRVVRAADPAVAAAELIAELLLGRLGSAPRATLAVSGGSSPLPMFDALARASSLDWGRVDVLQVDERVAPPRDNARNANGLWDRLVVPAQIPEANVHLMEVADHDPAVAAASYAQHLCRLTASTEPMIDVVHLGLGDDGHTASLVPGDPVLDVTDRDVATTALYQGHRRVTMTYPLLNRAVSRVWLVPSDGKTDAVTALVDGHPGAPAAGVRRSGSTVVTDLP